MCQLEYCTDNCKLAVHLPLKQGLRRFKLSVMFRHPVRLAVHLPLKQGLRHPYMCGHTANGKLAVHLPLKQGLRRNPLPDLVEIGTARSASSTKTRIKTEIHKIDRIRYMPRSASSTKTRIKTMFHVDSAPFNLVLAVHLPLKQGLRHLSYSFA